MTIASCLSEIASLSVVRVTHSAGVAKSPLATETLLAAVGCSTPPRSVSALRDGEGLLSTLTAPVFSTGARSGVLAFACTDGDPAGSICDKSGNAAMTIASCLSEIASLSVVRVTHSAGVAKSPLATETLLVAVFCSRPPRSVSALRDGEGLLSTLTAPVFSTGARTTVPHNNTATVANCRGFMIVLPSKPLPNIRRD